MIALSDNIYTNSSIRYTDNSEFDAAIDYRIGANYQNSDKLTWFASIGRASKNPSFTERFGFFAGTFQGNPNLKPEQSSNIEIGLRSKYVLANSQLNQQINVFVGKLENEINGFVYDAQTGNFTSDNVAGTSDRSGIEWELSWISADVSINASYSYTRVLKISATRRSPFKPGFAPILWAQNGYLRCPNEHASPCQGGGAASGKGSRKLPQKIGSTRHGESGILGFGGHGLPDGGTSGQSRARGDRV